MTGTRILHTVRRVDRTGGVRIPMYTGRVHYLLELHERMVTVQLRLEEIPNIGSKSRVVLENRYLN